MNQSKTWKWTRRAVWGSFLAVAAIGCNPLQLAGFIFAREDKEPAQKPLRFAKDGPKKDKEEVVIVLLPRVAPGSGTQFATAPSELADKLSRQLPEMAKENKDKDKRKFKVLSQTQVDKFKIANPTWNKMDPSEIGEKLGADFVLEIWLDRMRLYQPGSLNAIYEGRAEVKVSIYEVGTEGMKDKYEVSFAYPRTGVRSADAVSESTFKGLFLENLATDIANMHVDHKPSDTVANGR